MLIGIDASRLVPDSMAGTQYYLYNLINQLSLQDIEHTYIIYTKNRFTENFFNTLISDSPRFSQKVLDSTISFTQVSLAKATFRDYLDVLICPWQTIPVISSGRTRILSIIHDLAFPILRFGPTLFTSVFSDHIVAVSNYTKSVLTTKFLIDASKITVSYEGINKHKFKKSMQDDVDTVRKKYNLQGDYIVFMGTHVARKNIPRMLRAFSTILKTRGDLEIDFVIGGSFNKETNKIRELVSKLSLTDNVKLLGRVPDEDLVPLISGGMFMAYVSTSEGFGLPVLEAMSCGIPVLTGEVGALPEVGGNACYYVKPTSEYSIYTGMLELILNEELRHNLVTLGYENLKRFSWDQHGKDVLNLINNYAN